MAKGDTSFQCYYKLNACQTSIKSLFGGLTHKGIWRPALSGPSPAVGAYYILQYNFKDHKDTGVEGTGKADGQRK